MEGRRNEAGESGKKMNRANIDDDRLMMAEEENIAYIAARDRLLEVTKEKVRKHPSLIHFR